MADKNNEAAENETRIDDLPEKQVDAQDASAVKGGLARAGGDDDDDLDELEVQR